MGERHSDVRQTMDSGLTEWLLFQSRVIYLQTDTFRKLGPFSQQPPGGLAWSSSVPQPAKRKAPQSTWSCARAVESSLRCETWSSSPAVAVPYVEKQDGGSVLLSLARFEPLGERRQRGRHPDVVHIWFQRPLYAPLPNSHPLDGSLKTILHQKRWNLGFVGGFGSFF